MQKLPLTLTVITLNEEKNIARCIQSVPMASEIIVIDSQSTDKTVQIAQSLGAKTFDEKWQGFGLQKALAVEKSSFDWILSLDADEALSKELQNEIIEKFNQLNPQCGYRLPRRSFHLGRWIRFGGWYPDFQKRLFHRKHSFWRPVEIHESVESPISEKFQNPILHWVFKNKSHQVLTNDKYSSLQAKELRQNGKKFSWFKLLTKPISKFIECYLLKRGFLDGAAGFFIAVSAAYSVFLKWTKLWEIQKMNLQQESNSKTGTSTKNEPNTIPKNLILMVIFFSLLANLACFAKANSSQQKINYPLVSLAQGKSVIKDTIDIPKKLPRLYVLKEKAYLQTDQDGKIRIELSANSFLIIESNSILEIPYISEQKFSEIHLKSGQFRYVCHNSANCAIRVRTDIFDEYIGAGDFVLQYDPEVPKMVGYCFKGEMQFRGLEQEKKLLLTSGEYGIFIGQKTDQQIGFDILLRDQKVAKGQCSDVLKISESDKKTLAKSKDLITPPLYPIEEIPIKRPQDICEGPYAEFNQCAWVCENLPKGFKKCDVDRPSTSLSIATKTDRKIQCVRKRCFANGEWGDIKVLTGTQNICTAKPQVRRCDY